MKQSLTLTKGPIKNQLFKLTIPIIATNFIQTTYQLIDMIWVGKVGSDAVTAVGTATFYINLAMALLTLVSIGTGVKIAHSIGSQNDEAVRAYYQNGFYLATIIGIVYFIIVSFFHDYLISIFNLNEINIETLAKGYLTLSIGGILFSFYNGLFAVTLTSSGNSKLAFRISTIGFFINIGLDPLLIFGIGPFPQLGINGAALATIIANLIVTIVFVTRTNFVQQFRGNANLNFKKIVEVLKLGLPITLQRVTFIFISIVIAVIVARFGPHGIAVQRIGVQIEAISFMTIGGLQGAIAAFIGQNYGAKQWGRLKNGYSEALKLTIIFGALVMGLFLLFPSQLFTIFIQDEIIISEGIYYMRIIGLSQIFMCIELLTVGAFNGIGKTYIPPIFSISITVLRIPLAIILSQPHLFNLNGVWLSISMTSILKGIILVGWFKFTINRTVRGA